MKPQSPYAILISVCGAAAAGKEACLMIKCAIFDADGTLIDSMPMWRDITYEYAASKGIVPPEGLHRTLNRLSMEQCAEHYRKLGVQGSREQIVAELADWAFRGYRDRVREKPGAAEFVRLLHENGVAVAVATASHADGVKAALERCGILPCVDLILSCAQVGKSKEHPDIFLQCAAAFRASPGESAVFEDSAYALRTAKAAGFPVVAVEDGISMDGDGEGENPREIRAVSNRCIRDYNELIRELLPPEDDFSGALSRTVCKF